MVSRSPYVHEQNESVLSWFESLVVGRELVVTRGVKRPLDRQKNPFKTKGVFAVFYSLIVTVVVTRVQNHLVDH